MTTLSLVVLVREKKAIKHRPLWENIADEIVLHEASRITNFAVERNAALRKTTKDWVLFLDADEKLTPGLVKEIKKAISSTRFDGYFIKRQDRFLGRTLRYGENGAIRILRLAKRDTGEFSRPVHEIWEVKGRVGQLKNPLLHDPHPTISSFLEKINRYSSIEAEHRYNFGARSSLLNILIFPYAKFARNYIFRLGFLDGIPGMIMAVMMGFHSFLTWSKLYLLQKKVNNVNV